MNMKAAMAVLPAGLLIVMIIGLLGCTTTEITPHKNPQVEAVNYRSFLVVSYFQDTQHNAYLEHQVCEALIKKNAQCQLGSSIFGVNMPLSNAVFEQRFASSGAQALIVIHLTDAYHTTRRLFSSASKSISTYGNATDYRQAVSGDIQLVEDYNVSLIDGNSGKVPFVASSDTKGSAGKSDKKLVDSFASELVNQLDKAGFIQAD